MEKEKPDDQAQAAPEQVWEQMSDEQRARVLDLLTGMAVRYVAAQLKKAPGDEVSKTSEPVIDNSN